MDHRLGTPLAEDNWKQIWRTSLESPHTGERHGFASLELLFAFLETQTGGQLGRKKQPHEIGES